MAVLLRIYPSQCAGGGGRRGHVPVHAVMAAHATLNVSVHLSKSTQHSSSSLCCLLCTWYCKLKHTGIQ